MSYFIAESKEQIIDTISIGGIAIFPTDTVYGIGCKIDNRLGIEQIYSLKNRPANMSIAVLVNGMESAAELGIFTADQLNALNNFWPGALTAIVNAKLDAVGYGISSDNSIGLRWPNQPELNEIIKMTGPLATTSVNIHGTKPAVCQQDITNFLNNISGGNQIRISVSLGNDTLSRPSTVIDLRNETVQVVREGYFSEEVIKKAFNPT